MFVAGQNEPRLSLNLTSLVIDMRLSWTLRNKLHMSDARKAKTRIWFY